MAKIINALLTTQGLYLQSYHRTECALAYWIARDPAAQRAEADRLLAREGWRRTAEWAYCPVRRDGMIVSIVLIKAEETR